MLNAAKIQFSKEELLLLQNAQIILTKNDIMQKVVAMFSDLALDMQQQVKSWQPHLPEVLVASEPRISRGEQYRRLPWVMLDYPRIFGKTDICAFRCFFWWGNDISITLHLRGIFAETWMAPLENAIAENRLTGFALSISEDEWLHHEEAGTHLALPLLAGDNRKNHLRGRSFIKLRKGFPVHQLQQSPELLLEAFRSLLQVFLSVSYPGDERVP